jgi:hypothetical protein
MGKKKYTREDIIRILKELDAEGKRTSRKGLSQKGISQYWVAKLIPEGLTELKRELGIRITPQEEPHLTDELLKKIDETVSNLRSIPTWNQLERETKITQKVFTSRFGKRGIREVFVHYREWLEKNQPISKNIKLVDSYLEGRGKTKTPRSKPVKRKTSTTVSKAKRVPGSRTYGPPLNFKNLIYEPVNEQGVVFLFGMVSEALGFSIEWIGPDFPDCEAKRYIEGKGKRQQPVRIEFKFKSREFNYPVEGCDIIVCWEDNWGDDCPLEVIELRTKIEKLRERPEFSRK